MVGGRGGIAGKVHFYPTLVKPEPKKVHAKAQRFFLPLRLCAPNFLVLCARISLIR
jgi:hypothetical protein